MATGISSPLGLKRARRRCGIWTMPVEIEDAIRSVRIASMRAMTDRPRKFWRQLVAGRPRVQHLRTFLGKVSPVAFSGVRSISRDAVFRPTPRRRWK